MVQNLLHFHTTASLKEEDIAGLRPGAQGVDQILGIVKGHGVQGSHAAGDGAIYHPPGVLAQGQEQVTFPGGNSAH